MKTIRIAKLFSVILSALLPIAEVSAAGSIPRIEKNGSHYTFIVDDKPYFMFAGQAHNSSTWPRMLPQVWQTMEAMHANTLEIPVYWEQIEPSRGNYDFSMVQMLLDQAREHEMRLVLLWFGTWKNGSNHYMPQWMKKDSRHFPNITGRNGEPVDSPSPHCLEAMQLDAAAFSAFMRYLKSNDPQYTVIMVQVENEPGSWGSVRDYSKQAQKLFGQQVPEELLTRQVLDQLGVKPGTKGTWQEVFGERADEYFHAWHVASYIEYVAAAGKAVYDLPLYTNAALRNPLTNPMANEYESGGPTDNVIPIWKVAAPSLDLLAPDIYLSGDETCLKVLELYGREDNPLFVPESGGAGVRYLYNVVKDGIGFAPFGVDSGVEGQFNPQKNSAVSAEYAVLAPMSGLLAEWGAQGKIHVALEPEDHSDVELEMGNWTMVVKFSGNRIPRKDGNTGRIMVVQTGPDEFLTVGTGCRINFTPSGKYKGRSWQYLRCTEEVFEDGDFQMVRILNGDESDWGGPLLGNTPGIVRLSLTPR